MSDSSSTSSWIQGHSSSSERMPWCREIISRRLVYWSSRVVTPTNCSSRRSNHCSRWALEEQRPAPDDDDDDDDDDNDDDDDDDGGGGGGAVRRRRLGVLAGGFFGGGTPGERPSI
ncbi:unnamed protein product [Linum trigynum]|uniref:Uncharacterized protein n=1 Tax=Linum trigynum TaxID=586398 RepID=A0AAV2GNG2_9ROSI